MDKSLVQQGDAHLQRMGHTHAIHLGKHIVG